MGTTALQAAIAAPPHLSAVLAYMAGPSPYRGWAYTEGAFELGFATFWTTRGAWETLRRLDLDPERRAELTARLHDITARPLRDIADLPVADLGGIEELIPFWADWLAHPELDDFWQAVDVPLRAGAIRCPVLHVSGVSDNLVAGHLELNAALAEHPDQAVRDTHRFVLGPWDHESYQTSRPSASGQVDFGPQARNGLALNDALGREWFDHWLLGADADADALLDAARAVLLHRRGPLADGRPWPPEHSELQLYLASDGRANGSAGDGRLAAAPAEARPRTRSRPTRATPSPASAAARCRPSSGRPACRTSARSPSAPTCWSTRASRSRPTWSSPGARRLVLHADTDAPTTDFTGKVVDVEPDGYCRNVAEGIVRLRAGPRRGDHDRPAGDRAHLPRGPPHPRRGRRQPVPALRPQPERARAPRARGRPGHPRRAADRAPRRGAPVAARPSRRCGRMKVPRCD